MSKLRALEQILYETLTTTPLPAPCLIRPPKDPFYL